MVLSHQNSKEMGSFFVNLQGRQTHVSQSALTRRTGSCVFENNLLSVSKKLPPLAHDPRAYWGHSYLAQFCSEVTDFVVGTSFKE